MHLVKSGGSGTVAFAALDFDATVSQWLNSALSMESPFTVATASPGTPPQPAAKTAVTARTHRARKIRTALVMRSSREGFVDGYSAPARRAHGGGGSLPRGAWQRGIPPPPPPLHPWLSGLPAGGRPPPRPPRHSGGK